MTGPNGEKKNEKRAKKKKKKVAAIERHIGKEKTVGNTKEAGSS